MDANTKGFTLSTQAAWILLNSGKSAIAMLLFGTGGGLFLTSIFDQSWLASFGAVTIALGVGGFGVVASELLNRAQDALWAREDDDPSEPFSQGNIRRALKYQTFVVVFGTLQNGFGNQIMGLLNAHS